VTLIAGWYLHFGFTSLFLLAPDPPNPQTTQIPASSQSSRRSPTRQVQRRRLCC
jgi:hypothetical protein